MGDFRSPVREGGEPAQGPQAPLGLHEKGFQDMSGPANPAKFGGGFPDDGKMIVFAVTFMGHRGRHHLLRNPLISA